MHLASSFLTILEDRVTIEHIIYCERKRERFANRCIEFECSYVTAVKCLWQLVVVLCTTIVCAIVLSSSTPSPPSTPAIYHRGGRESAAPNTAELKIIQISIYQLNYLYCLKMYAISLLPLFQYTWPSFD